MVIELNMRWLNPMVHIFLKVFKEKCEFKWKTFHTI